MSIITLVRHGQASAGTDDYDRLSPLGKQQAEHLGHWWTKTSIAPTAAFAGTLKRQQHTAELSLGQAKISLDIGTLPNLDEYTHQEVDKRFGGGFTSDAGVNLTFNDYLGIMERWRDASTDQLEGTESWETFMSRGVSAMQAASDAVGPDGHALLFTSGGVIATLIGALQSHPFSVIIENIWNIRNSSTSTLSLKTKNAQLLDFNAVPHLEWHNDEELITLI